MIDPKYKYKLRAIRPFVSFNYDLRKPLSPAQKSKITRYFNQLRSADNDNAEIYRPRSAKNAKVAQQFADVKGSEWKAFPLKKSIEGASVKIRDGKITFDSGMLGYNKVYLLDQVLVVIDADKACRKAGVPRRIKKNQRYMILTGGNDFNSTFKKYEVLIANLEKKFIEYVSASTGKIDFRLDVQIISYLNATKEATARYVANTKKTMRSEQRRRSKKSLK